jgi:hypothetical protein
MGELHNPTDLIAYQKKNIGLVEKYYIEQIASAKKILKVNWKTDGEWERAQ